MARSSTTPLLGRRAAMTALIQKSSVTVHRPAIRGMDLPSARSAAQRRIRCARTRIGTPYTQSVWTPPPASAAQGRCAAKPLGAPAAMGSAVPRSVTRHLPPASNTSEWLVLGSRFSISTVQMPGPHMYFKQEVLRVYLFLVPAFSLSIFRLFWY